MGAFADSSSPHVGNTTSTLPKEYVNGSSPHTWGTPTADEEKMVAGSSHTRGNTIKVSRCAT